MRKLPKSGKYYLDKRVTMLGGVGSRAIHTATDFELANCGGVPNLLNVVTLLMSAGEDEGHQTNRWCQDSKRAGVKPEFPGAAMVGLSSPSSAGLLGCCCCRSPSLLFRTSGGNFCQPHERRSSRTHQVRVSRGSCARPALAVGSRVTTFFFLFHSFSKWHDVD